MKNHKSNGQTGKRDSEAELFEKSSDKAKALFAEAKKVRRQAERRTWWNEHGKKTG